MNRQRIYQGLIALTSLLSAVGALAQDDAPMMVKSQSGVEIGTAVDWSMCSPDGVSLGGYDVVSYRDPDGPVMGDSQFSAAHAGRTYWFASDERRLQFLERPDYYLPAYSGFCAITLALGRVTCPEYTNFKLEDDRLYLFEVTGFTNGRVLWNSDSSGFRRQADDNFAELSELR
ncbi:MAG: hypothetical protein K0U72_12465 [Gammaproteobacteria bacterium]|nr:hypothetical protein [Gammaproteobacteria bacterium]